MPDAPADYTAQALRTESPITEPLQFRLQYHARLVHAVLGLQTEAGELADPVKKHIYYGRPLDSINLREEIGDCLWYLAIACDALGTTLEAEQARNLAKLRSRYPERFTETAAQVRDLDRERQVLEGTEILQLRQELDAARAETVAVRRRLNEETDRHRKTNAEKIELFEQKEWANKHAAELVRERDAARAEIETLRKQLADAQRSASDEFTERQVLMVEAQQDAAAWQQKLDAAHQTILAQKAGNQYLRLVINKVREIVGREDAMSDRLKEIAKALDDFDHGTIGELSERNLVALHHMIAQREAAK